MRDVNSVIKEKTKLNVIGCFHIKDLKLEMKQMNGLKDNKGRTRVTCWSRVVGYLRPTDRYNNGKLAEYKDRKMFITK